eukprot:TRINITY_DN5196_c0_g1_i1.p1 TRINITY_DN5196_c0_g1~~TRINITY_DN5196_c0_g1_i1.p1  ORF type:complete len:126 (-),score=44.36 TRINITY_DN5196_c0_g1_i1:148-495(-)
MITTGSGLQYRIVTAGTGATPKKGQKVITDYTGWLTAFHTGKKFDSSVDKNRKFEFQAGAGNVIKGWDEAILQMREGETRQIIVPPELGYGARGAGGVIPPNATLYFEMTLHKCA